MSSDGVSGTDGSSSGVSSADALVTVQLIDLPVPLHARAREHSDAIQREFLLIAEQLRGQDTASVPDRLIELMRSLSSDYAGYTGEQDDALEAAMASGQPTLDLELRLPPGAADGARALGAMLDEADDYCRAGQHLLTLPTPAELVAYRRWYLDQVISQIDGAPPQPWPPPSSG